MAPTQAELRDELHKEVFLLRTLKEDALCNLYRGGPDAELEWERIEPLVSQAFARAERDVSDESCWTVARAATALRHLCARLRLFAEPY